MCGGDQVSAYLVDDFDPRRRAVQLLSAGDDVAQILAQLSLSISQVDKQLRKQIESHHEKLLEQATSIESLDTMQRSIQEHMATLATTASRAQSRSATLLQRAASSLQRLERARNLLHLLASAQRVIVLTRRLTTVSDLLKRSEMLQELQVVCAELPPTLLATRLVEMNRVSHELRVSTRAILTEAMHTGNTSNVVMAMQALGNLGCRDAEISQLLDTAETELNQVANGVEKKGGDSRGVYQFVGRVETLTRQFELLGCEQHLLALSQRIAKLIATRLASPTPHTARLLQLLQPVLATLPESCATVYGDALNPLRAALISHAVTRFLRAIDALFQDGDVPTNIDIDKLSATFRGELATVTWDNRLTHEMTAGIDKALSMFVVRVETAMCLDAIELGEERLSDVQRRNYHLLNAIGYVREQWPMCEQAGDLVVAVISALMQRAEHAVNAVLLSMHDERFHGHNKGDAVSSVSPYMRELLAILSRVRMHHLNCLRPSPQLSAAVATFVEHVELAFVMHASLVRPIDSVGSLRLATDADRLNEALVQFDASDRRKLLTHAARVLRSPSPSLDDAPVWLLVQVLISRSPSSMPSPHASAGWSREQFVEWSSTHSDADRCAFLRGLVQGYSAAVIARNETEFVENYPIMVQLLQE